MTGTMLPNVTEPPNGAVYGRIVYSTADRAAKTVVSSSIFVLELVPAKHVPSARIIWIRFYGSTVSNCPLSQVLAQLPSDLRSNCLSAYLAVWRGLANRVRAEFFPDLYSQLWDACALRKPGNISRKTRGESVARAFGESALTNALEQHIPLNKKLKSKGCEIVDEFLCPGFNTNSFLRIFGGINKDGPNAEDLRHAEEFASDS
jgi:hypothetical protein